MTQRSVFLVALVVRNYDEAIEFYTQKLNFYLVEDTKLSDTKRWVRIAPSKDASFTLLLAQAANEEQNKSVGYQTGGRVFLFMHTDNLQREYDLFVKNGVKIIREPSEEEFGKVFVFADLYGNLWDLIEPK
jgi:catechol 2,3-dioxygenase-like lactoylglutathione lyase family enzyme